MKSLISTETLTLADKARLLAAAILDVRQRTLGGAGSGNFGHAGRPGLEGGSASQTGTPEFKAWFGQSKIVNADGTPQRVYHATPKDFDRFIPGGLKPYESGPAIWLAFDPAETNAWHHLFGSVAEDPATGNNMRQGVRTVPLYARVENPLVVTLEEARAFRKTMDIASAIPGTPRTNGAFPLLIKKEEIKWLKQRGYDGIILRQKSMDLQRGEGDGDADELIVFDARQLKSAIGNSGKFSRRSSLIAAGGSGSGNFGHAGRPGIEGGSAPSGVVPSLPQREINHTRAYVRRLHNGWLKEENIEPGEKTLLEEWGVRSLNDYEQAMNETLERALTPANTFIRMNQTDLNAILADGQIRNMFETGRSHAVNNREKRRAVDEHLFGIPKDAPGSARPVYGYLAVGDGITGLGRRLGGAGFVAVKLKRSTRDRTTFVVGDSLDDSLGFQLPSIGWAKPESDTRTFIPQPVTKPTLLAVPNGHFDASLRRARIHNFSSYTEAQVHGPVRVSDIAAVTFGRGGGATKPSAQLLKRLKSLGIPVKFVEIPPKPRRLRAAEEMSDDWMTLIYDPAPSERALGGPGSGNFGHAGRPGIEGGSAPSSVGKHYATMLTKGKGATDDDVQRYQDILDRLPPEFLRLAGGEEGLTVTVESPIHRASGELYSNPRALGIYDGQNHAIRIKPAAKTYVLVHELGHALHTELGFRAVAEFVQDASQRRNMPAHMLHLIKHYTLSSREAFAQAVAYHLSPLFPNKPEFQRGFPHTIAKVGRLLNKLEIPVRQSKPAPFTGKPRAAAATDELEPILYYVIIQTDEGVRVSITSEGDGVFTDGMTVQTDPVLPAEVQQGQLGDVFYRKPRTLGGPGSGNFGHAGRPGKIGGSSPNGPGGTVPQLKEQLSEIVTREATQRQIRAAAQTNPLAHPQYVLGSASYGSTQRDSEEFVAAYGQEFKGAPLPAHIPRGTPKECFRNASMLVMRDHELTYVEGFATTASLPGVTFWHAWAIDKNGTVIDPTWSNPETSTYFGVKYKRDPYLKHLYTSGVFGVMTAKEKSIRRSLDTGVPLMRAE